MASTGQRPRTVDVLGREAELGLVEGWLRSDPPGERTAAALVIDGQPGIGKTTLWDETVRRARGMGWLVLAARAVPSDAGLPHAGLADLLNGIDDPAPVQQLPGPQRRALRIALLQEDPDEGPLEPRVVGTALRSLLGALAAARPLLLAVDDAQWVDPASARAVAFALRRLPDLPVRLVAAVRSSGAFPALPVPRTGEGAADPVGDDGPGPAEPTRGDTALTAGGAFGVVTAGLGLRGVLRLTVGPLSLASTHRMFLQTLGGSFPRPVLVRIHQATAGNPFYALEIAREVRRVGPPSAGRPLPVPADHRQLAGLRLGRFPPATRDALAVVAAMARPSVADVDLDALAPAEVAGIVAVGPDGAIAFTHPLFASALYASLPEAARRRLHRRLADRAATLEERSRHLALATDGPDETAASVLDEAAASAGARGAVDIAVDLAELACRATPAGNRSGLLRRSLALAERRYFAGDPAGARRELERWADALPPGDDRARVRLELGSVVSVQGDGESGRALMTQALAEAVDPRLLARIHARIASDADDSDIGVQHAEAALALLDERDDPQLYSFALHNAALFKLYSGRGADHDAIARGMRLQRETAAWEMSSVPAFWARNLDEFATALVRFEGLLRAAREQGDQATVSGLLTHMARLEAMTGHMDRARALADEALVLAEQTEQGLYETMALCAKAHVHVFAGELAEARELIERMMRRLDDQPDVILEGMARMVLGAAALSAGELAEADRQLSRSDEIEERMHHREPATNRFQADHAEAVIGLGDLARAERLVRRLEARAAALPRPWTTAVAARCRGLLQAAAGDLTSARASYERALLAHETLDMPSEQGRTLLALGRLHRRLGERQLAQECLQRAVAVFGGCGAAAWQATAAGELARARGRGPAAGRLSPTELQICELAAGGLRNHEIAARLFLSGKTVEANLSRAYRKLGVRSRTELAGQLAAARTGQGAQP